MKHLTLHMHHIIPKHMGGSNDPSNLIELTLDEHAQAHKELWVMCGHWQDRVAWQTLSGQIGFEEAIHQTRVEAQKERWSKPGAREAQSERWKKNNPNLLNPKIGKLNGMYGKKFKKTPEAIEKTARHIRIYAQTEDWKERARQQGYKNHGLKRTKEQKEKHRLTMLGHKQTEYQKQAVSKALSRSYLITHPNGKTEIILGLTKFCKMYGIDQGNMSAHGHTKGYKLQCL